MPVERQLVSWPVAKFQADPAQPRKEFAAAALLELGHNLRERGQQVPLLAFVDESVPDVAIIVDGERRFRAAQAVGLTELDVLLLPARPNPTELLLAQLSVNQFRAALTTNEEYHAFRTLLDELKLTQVELAEKLGVSASKISKILARERIDPALRLQADALDAAVLPLLTPLPPEAQAEAITFAMTVDASGRRPNRDAVKRYLKARTTKPKPGPKAKWLTLAVGGRQLKVSAVAGETHDQLIDWLKAVTAFVNKSRNVPVVNLHLIPG